MLEILDIESSGSDIGSNENRALTILEHGECLVTLLLGLVTVDSDAVPLLIPKVSADILADVLFVDKDDGSLKLSGGLWLGTESPDIDQKLGERIHLVSVLHNSDLLNDVCVSLKLKTSDLDLESVFKKLENFIP